MNWYFGDQQWRIISPGGVVKTGGAEDSMSGKGAGIGDTSRCSATAFARNGRRVSTISEIFLTLQKYGKGEEPSVWRMVHLTLLTRATLTSKLSRSNTATFMWLNVRDATYCIKKSQHMPYFVNAFYNKSPGVLFSRLLNLEARHLTLPDSAD